MKICSKCKFDYPNPLEDYFNKRSSAKDGFQQRCKNCIALFHKEHYQQNKEYYKKKSSKHNAEYRVRNLQYMVDYLKENPCIDCGEKDPIVLEFDHLSNKDCNVSEMQTVSLSKIKKEIEKCVIRCANCHKLKTAKQFNYYKDIKI